MTVEEIYTKLGTHMKEGTLYHHEFAKAYEFLGLRGYAECQLYHYFEEQAAYCRFSQHFAKHWFKLLKLDDIPHPTIIPDSWYKYNSQAVDTGTKRNAIKELMTKWIAWEKSTKKLYQELRNELYTLGEVAAALNLDKYIVDVDKELRHAERKLLALETIGYDIIAIMDEQEALYQKYKKKLGW